jgi:FAD:protein FMN transferase
MKLHSNTETRRCRPLLGTFVEIAADACCDATLSRGIDEAFNAMAKVQRLMSFHDPSSDVSRMNRGAFLRGVTVHPWTWQVMRAARRFAVESHGAFDVTVAPVLAESNHLPKRGYPSDPKATARDIFLRNNNKVSFRRALTVDLGGIAKGFAVDRAVEALLDAGVSSGIVNAGGDLRIFGSKRQVVHLRHPDSPQHAAGAVVACDRAIATSAIYFARHNSAIIDGRTRRASADFISVTVASEDCMTADALTKVVFALRERSAPLLRRHLADALVLERSGAPYWVFQPHAS